MKIVFIVSRVPFPLEKGDKLRAYHQLKELSKSNEVHLICLDDSQEAQAGVKTHLESICASVTIYPLTKFKLYFRLIRALFSKKPYQVHYFHELSIAKKIKRQILELNPQHIYCQLIRTSEYVKKLYQYPKTLDYMDAFSKGMFRRIEDETFYMKPFVRAEASRLTTYENLIFDYFDHKTIISEQDRDCIYHKNRKSIHIITNGIDSSLLHNTKEQTEKYDLLFHGNLSYIPNINCVKYIVENILPDLLLQKPDVKIAISGSSPTKKVHELCNLYPKNISLLGFVDDIIETYKSAKVFFAPLQIGTGLQNKLLEAMALKVPCITSELCNNALKATNGIHILTGKTSSDFIQQIQFLLNNKHKRNEIAHEGHNFVQQHFSWEKSTQELLTIMQTSTH